MEVTDVVELLNSTSANMYADQGIFLSVLTAYMIVSYMVGRDLSRTQVLIINILFLMVTVSGAVGLSTLLVRYFELAAMLPDGSGFKASPSAASATASFTGVIGFFGFRVSAILVALYFMWDIRHPKTE